MPEAHRGAKANVRHYWKGYSAELPGSLHVCAVECKVHNCGTVGTRTNFAGVQHFQRGHWLLSGYGPTGGPFLNEHARGRCFLVAGAYRG